MNNRRKLLVAFGAAVLASPFAAFAQQPGKVWRVGILAQGSRPASSAPGRLDGFLRGMRELGYVEGKNLIIEWRFSDGKVEPLPSLAIELVNAKVDIIVAPGSPAASAAQKATSTIPIVMANVIDPVEQGLVKTLAHPGGNITGVSTMSGELGPKHLEMLLSMAPNISRVTVLAYANSSAHAKILKDIVAAGQGRNVRILPAKALTLGDVDTVFASMAKDGTQAFIVVSHPIFNLHARQIAGLAAKYRRPLISGPHEYAEAGGLLSYGANLVDGYRRAATYVDKIFKGANPADLPVEQPTQFELLINRRTAKTLGITIPQSLLISADKVVD